MDFYSLDYRIRRCIRQLLEQRRSDAHTAFQLALCNYIGFGGPQEEQGLNKALHSSGRTREELEDAVASLRPFDREEKRYTGKVLYALEKSGDVFDSTPSAHYILEGAETAMRHELRDLESSLGKSSRLWLFSAGHLAWTYEHLNRWQSAEDLRKELVLVYKTLVSEDSSAMLQAKQNLARTYFHLQRHQEAQELQGEVVDSLTRSLGKDSARTLQSLTHLAIMYENQGQWEQAKELEVYIMDERKKTLGEEHEMTLHSMGQLASINHKQGQWKESRELWVQVVEKSKRALGDEDPTTLVHTDNLARAYRDRGYLKEAKELQEQTYRTSNTVFGEGHPRTLHSLAQLARTLWKQGAHLEAEGFFRQILALNGHSLDEEKFRWIILTDLEDLLKSQGRYADATSIHWEVLESKKRCSERNIQIR
jgi:tetratricopeptide (TPR) repeat protein